MVRPMPYLCPRDRPREPRSMDRLLTADEVAERLGVRTDWVWAQARAGRIPHVRLGRYRRFRESALEAWICGSRRTARDRRPRGRFRYGVARSSSRPTTSGQPAVRREMTCSRHLLDLQPQREIGGQLVDTRPAVDAR